MHGCLEVPQENFKIKAKKNQKSFSLLFLKYCTQTSSNLQNSFAVLIFSALEKKYSFWANWSTKLKLSVQTEISNIITAPANILEREGIIFLSNFYGKLPNYYSHVLVLSTQYISSSVCSSCYRTKLELWVNLRFLLLIMKMRERSQSKIFLCYPKGSGTSHQSFCELGGLFSACRLFVSDEANGGWFLLDVQLDSTQQYHHSNCFNFILLPKGNDTILTY